MLLKVNVKIIEHCHFQCWTGPAVFAQVHGRSEMIPHTTQRRKRWPRLVPGRMDRPQKWIGFWKEPPKWCPKSVKKNGRDENFPNIFQVWGVQETMVFLVKYCGFPAFSSQNSGKIWKHHGWCLKMYDVVTIRGASQIFKCQTLLNYTKRVGSLWYTILSLWQ